MKYPLFTILLLYSLSGYAQIKRNYVNAQLSFDCQTKLILQDSGVYFGSSSCKGFAHITKGAWSVKDSSLHLQPINDWAVVSEVQEKKHLKKTFTLELQDCNRYPISLPSNYEVILTYSDGRKAPDPNSKYDFERLALSPKEVKEVQFTLFIGSREETFTFEVKPHTKIILSLAIPASVMGYRGNSVDDIFSSKTFHIRADGLYSEEGRIILR